MDCVGVGGCAGFWGLRGAPGGSGGVHGERLEAAAARGETRGQSSLRGDPRGAAGGGGGQLPRRWQPGIQNPQRGMVVWVVPETLEVVVTLYRDPQAATFDDKSWNFLVVNESRGRRSVVAAAPLELGRLAGVGDTPLSLSLRPRSRKVTTATLRLRLRGLVLMEGHPTDEDMQSVTSLCPPGDVADLGDFESDPEDEGGAHRAGGAPPAPRAPPPRRDPPHFGDAEGPPGAGRGLGAPPKNHRGEWGRGGDARDPLNWGGGGTPIWVWGFWGRTDPSPRAHPPSQGPPGGRGALLAWCQGLTAGYPGVAVTDFGGSWSSGLGFCALLHRLRAREIDFEALDPRDHRGNNKRAFDAFAALGVPRLLDPSDMETPDSLGVMTFLSQVRALLGTPPGDPPATPERLRRGGGPKRPPRTPRSGSAEEGTPPESPSDVTEGGPQTTPPGDPPWRTPRTPRAAPLRREHPRIPPVTSPRGGPQTTPPGTPPAPPKWLQRGGAPRTPPETPRPPQRPNPGPPPEPQSSVTQGGRQETPADPPQRDTEQGEPPPGPPPARPHRGGGAPRPPPFGEGSAGPGAPPPPGPARGSEGGVSPRPPPRSRSLPRLRDPDLRRSGEGPRPPREALGGGAGGGVAVDPPMGGGDLGSPPVSPPLPSPPPQRPQRSPPEPPEEESGGQWVAAELVALEQDQARLDAQAPALERELRALMDSGADPAREERLLRDWFSLVQQRNLLVRRQDQLQLLAQERDLERRFELLSRELRGLLGTEEWQKPPAQRQREQLLLEELVALVNRRDRLVRDRHRRETRAQEEDEELERSLDPRRRRFGRRETCGIS
ncbi:EH domain-binding protein 1-like protein 1 [Chamaea fasciata]|uniref:EH domain-binding protein 1-like protein 1 n=1 Tax=Chamaea fasciata TaxID=190680 RepID=UPI00336A4DCA